MRKHLFLLSRNATVQSSNHGERQTSGESEAAEVREANGFSAAVPRSGIRGERENSRGEECHHGGKYKKRNTKLDQYVLPADRKDPRSTVRREWRLANDFQQTSKAL